MKDINYFELIYTHRSEMASGGFPDLLKEDADYQKALEAEQLAEKECEALDLTEKERELVNWWGDEAHNESGMYAKAAYRMGMTDCFLMLRKLGAFNNP